MTKAQLIHLIDVAQIQYIKDDDNNDMPIREQSFSEYLAEAILTAWEREQDRR